LSFRIFAIALTLAGSACSERALPIPLSAQGVIDDTGNLVETKTPPVRIISLIPSATQLLVAMGAADRVIGRTAYDNEPELREAPVISGTLAPSAEVVLALRPDLVIAWPQGGSGSLIRDLRAVDVPIYASNPQSIADIRSTARRLGDLLWLRSKADSVDVALTARLTAWAAPPYTVGPGSHVDEIIRLAGGRNVFSDLPTAWSEVSLEELVKRNPDFIVIPEDSRQVASDGWLQQAAGWRGLRAVQERRVVRVSSDLFNRPGPWVDQAVEVLAAALHPDAVPLPVEAGNPADPR
jgi:ABC-type Fe3+-hydroxamate transport system substrate-binding protein